MPSPPKQDYKDYKRKKSTLLILKKTESEERNRVQSHDENIQGTSMVGEDAYVQFEKTTQKLKHEWPLTEIIIQTINIYHSWYIL